MSGRVFSRTFKKPRRPYEKERMYHELKIVGEFALKNKKEIWRVHFMLSKLRKAARELLMLPEDNIKRKFEGTALLNRLVKLGVLPEEKKALDYVLSLTVEDLLERRLQTLVQKNLASSIHEARTLINHRHISMGTQLVDQPGLLVWKDNAKEIGFAATSVHSQTGKLGRKKRLSNKNDKNKSKQEDEIE